MIKYFKELEDPNNFILPLYEKKYDLFVKREVKKGNFPSDFFKRHEKLFVIIRNIEIFIKNIDMKKISGELRLKKYEDEQGRFDSKAYDADWHYFGELNKLK